ncbi:MAG: isoleucine--tRNA ligase [Pirellulaceae bacterium]
MFKPVPANASFPKLEEEVLKFWSERKIYEQSLARRAGAPRFVFYEGPPTANGMPHPGHTLRAIKDLFPRYKTMRGYHCERKAGWDTHGLPVEVEVCKELKIHTKEEIEQYGVEEFIHKCQESVWRYMKEWERLTERIGFWIRLDEAYVTYHQSYVESVWWSLKNLFDRGLLYQGHKIVWWWAQGGTALSAGEVGQGYREVADPSVYVLFPLIEEGTGDRGQETLTRSASEGGTSLLVWTTTPWTLPSNQFAAVHPDLDYATVEDSETGQKIIIAAALVETIAGKVKRELKVVSTCKGTDLVGRRYVPPFDYYFKDVLEYGVYLNYVDEELASDEEAETAAFRQVRESWEKELREGGECEWLKWWRIQSANFVTTESGSGIVHIAPAFGEVDFALLNEISVELSKTSAPFLGPTLICPVAPNGDFRSPVDDYQGRWVKDCDKDLTRRLRDEGKLYHQEQYLHDYPFCWRAEEDPLIQYPRKSWFIKTTQFKEAMLANNEQINWLPQHIKHGRFGNFLESNVDWALSRERYWGTPLPIWVCQQTGKMEAIGSYEELLAKPGVSGTEVWDAAKKAKPSLSDDLKVHKPYIDAVTYDSPFAAGAKMKRVPDVIDCWYDSGAMPFAQWGYRGEDGPQPSREKFHEQFPADFIAEGLDQTRGWFYSQLAISTMLFGEGVQSSKFKVQGSSTLNLEPETLNAAYPHPFRNCIVWGLMLGEWWESPDGKQIFLTEAEGKEKLGDKLVKRVGKMSKSKRNYREPGEIFDKFGADALRWYLFANQPPWSSILYAERAIKDSIPEFLLRLWNCYSFFVIYANIDGFDPAVGQAASLSSGGQLNASDFKGAKGYRPYSERSELDRWVLSQLNDTLKKVVGRMDDYDNFDACKWINKFVEGLSNWYVRRSRDRFWAADRESQEKLDAYWTLYECLLTTAKMIAPFTPFLAETLWRNLAGVFGERTVESVHLSDYPLWDVSFEDHELLKQMSALREIAALGLSARMANKLKVRQPLAKVEVILSDATHQKWLQHHDELLRDELNVKQIDYATSADQYITYLVQPNFKQLGPKIGKLLPGVKAALGKADGAALLAQLTATGKVTLDIGGEKVDLDNEDIQVRLQAKPGWAAAQGSGCVVVLATELTPELLAEGLARDFVRIIQDRRKDLNLDFTDRIEVGIVGASPALQKAITDNLEYISGETLAVKVVFEALPGRAGIQLEIGDEQITLDVCKV